MRDLDLQNPPIRNGIMNHVRVMNVCVACKRDDKAKAMMKMIAAAIDGS